MTKRAILSVYDKSGLIDLANELVAIGWELIASGGTARSLREAGLPVRDVAELTGAPEMLGGRVKTLHPAIHGGILARDQDADMADLAAHHIEPVDMVVCNLYPFEQTVVRPDVTLEEAIEQIDIGGVTLLRAGAKNFTRVMVLSDPADYSRALAALHQGGSDEAFRLELATKAFGRTWEYDAAIASYLAGSRQPLPDRLDLRLVKIQALRYGENPHQAACLYSTQPGSGPLGGRLIQGKPLSYNNLLDLDAAWAAAESFIRPAVVIVKHLSPCGIAIGESVAAAFPAALASDPVSAFGGVIAVNRPVVDDFIAAPGLRDLFVEAIIAPTFSPEVVDWFAANKKNCRLVALGESVFADEAVPEVAFRSVRGGVLAQTRDSGDPPDAGWRIVSRRTPTEHEEAALRFAWIACRHVKSNAIVFATDTATVGIGGGLTSRVDAVRLAALKSGNRARGAVMASDAFFPFADGIEVAAGAGVVAVVEPGGSVRDDEVIAAADRLGMALIFTGARHFRH